MRRKGFEPIIAALLLVIITIIAAAAIYLWSSGLISGAGTGTAKFAFQVEVYDATYSNGTLTIKAILKNTGNAPIIITDIKVRDLTRASDFYSAAAGQITAQIGGTDVTQTYTLNPGEIVDTTITISNISNHITNAAPGDKFEILFVFSDGTTYSLIVQTRG